MGEIEGAEMKRGCRGERGERNGKKKGGGIEERKNKETEKYRV